VLKILSIVSVALAVPPFVAAPLTVSVIASPLVPWCFSSSPAGAAVLWVLLNGLSDHRHSGVLLVLV
jgi:hypothetical protein